MKSTVELNPKAPFQGLSFPCLMQHSIYDLVVMFHTPTAGMVLASTDSVYSTGNYVDSWSPADSDNWKPLDGRVTLEN